MPRATRDPFVWDVEDLDPRDIARFGGKGAGLARMVKAGIPVPPGFVIGTDVFRAYHANGTTLPPEIESEVDAAIRRLESRTAKRFGRTGDEAEPLLVSVRSGAPISMPGMMDTVLNLGLDAPLASAFASIMRSPGFAIDTWLRFWRMFVDIVLALDPDDFEADIEAAKTAAVAQPSRATFDALERTVIASLAGAGVRAPISPRVQLDLAISAVFRSWDSRRAKTYRANFGIAEDLGTAVTVQAMVFGNRDAASGSGVAFSCNPNTGERGLFGEYVAGRQGEDIVSGTATPVDLSQPGGLGDTLHDALRDHARTLENQYRDAVDIEFTVESGRLFLLQVRAAKRTAEAAVRIAAELLRAGAIPREEALRRVTPEQLAKLLRPTFEATALQAARVLARGIGSSPGHASGDAILDADEAADRAASGRRVILLRPTTSPQDIHGMFVAEGIVTARGGALSHAAVVSRALDKPCVVGCEAIDVDVRSRSFAVDGETFSEGTALSIDGETGCVYLADLPVRPASGGGGDVARLIAAATEVSTARVAASALDFADVARMGAAPDAEVIVGLTDLLICAGTIDRLTNAIAALGASSQTTSPEDEIEALARDVATRALGVSNHARVAFRLPSFLSERARAIVPDWTGLPARSLLPLGEKRFYGPIARGIATAARENPAVSLLLGGVTEFAEIDGFRRDLHGIDFPTVGAVVRSFAGVQNFSLFYGEDVEVWIDVDAVVRSAYGFPSELMAARGVFAEYRERGCVTIDPQVTVAPFLLAAFEALLQRVGPKRAGAFCNPSEESETMTALYAIGYRRFAVPANAREQVCLRLARAAIGVQR